MRTGFQQAGGILKVSTPFDKNDLLLDAMEGSEGISELFKFSLHMRSGSTSLAAAKIVGKSVTVTLEGNGGGTRHFNGICSRFIQSGFDRDFAVYEAEVVPKLWLLTLSRNRKIYQGKTVDTIVKEILTDFGVNVRSELTKNYPELDYCVQYDETALEFIVRLMERVGIFYFFTFDSTSHTMILGDAPANFSDCSGATSIRFFPETGMANATDTISRFAWERGLSLKKATVDDYDFKTPTNSLIGTHVVNGGEGDHYEFATGHTNTSEGNALAQLRVEASQAGSDLLRGDSFAYAFTAGTKFTLKDHFVPSLNSAYVLRRVHHTARQELYTNSFEAFPATAVFHPPMGAPRPRAAGCETALVVGPSGEEIWTDKYGRIKVQFSWDREGKKDDKSSPWIRVAQSLAGKSYGAFFLPRVGQEVVISYLNGDPDRPLVTGCVYNGTNTTPYTLPANQTQSGIVTRSSKQGSAGNELRFEDRKDSEEVFLHAQRDLKVNVENALTTMIKKGAETHTLEEGDRTLELKKGKETHKVKDTRAVEVTGDETHTNKAKYTHVVTGDYSLTVNGKLTITVNGDFVIKTGAAGTLEASTNLLVKAGAELTNHAGTTLTAEAGTELKNQAGTNLTNKAGMKLTNQAAMQIDNKAAIINSKADATQTVEAGALLALKGAVAKVN